jgi:ABC-type transporter Mla maintaining outer membrane lipid asymmetry permease subunit MlaE
LSVTGSAAAAKGRLTAMSMTAQILTIPILPVSPVRAFVLARFL